MKSGPAVLKSKWSVHLQGLEEGCWDARGPPRVKAGVGGPAGLGSEGRQGEASKGGTASGGQQQGEASKGRTARGGRGRYKRCTRTWPSTWGIRNTSMPKSNTNHLAQWEPRGLAKRHFHGKDKQRGLQGVTRPIALSQGHLPVMMASAS